MAQQEANTHKGSGRVRAYDALRGLSVISMVGFHLCYDLVYLAGVEVSWFVSPFMDIWRASISWTFLLIAGCMCAHSRSNLKRSGVYAVVALAIYAVTKLAAVDVPISFGIIYCMAACTFCAWMLERAHIVPEGPTCAIVLFLVFLFVLPVTSGYVGLGSLRIALPRALYDCGLLSWAGFPGPAFASGDYYPLLPYLPLYLTGSAIGHALKKHGYPTWAYGPVCPPLELVGRHALLVYALHQPLLLLVVGLV